MKALLLSFIFGLAFFAVPSLAQSDEEKQEIIKQFFAVVAECQKEYPSVSNESVRHMLRHETVPVTPDEKCLASCVLNKGGLVKDGKIVVEGWRKVSSAKWNNKDDAEKATESAANCAKKEPKGKDQCQTAAKVLGCIVKENRKLGVPPPDVPQ